MTDKCYWCGETIVDGRDISGYTGTGHDWATLDTDANGGEYIADFGCEYSPLTGEDGTGGHNTKQEIVWLLDNVVPQC